MIDIDNQSDLTIDQRQLEAIAAYLSSRDLELVITDDETMQALNQEHRGKATTTDVLSFPLETPFTEASLFELPLGSIVIASSYVQENARKLGHSIHDELALLFIHGMLHLLGYDHEIDSGEMREREEAIITHFQLPESLIIRTEK